MSKLEFDFVDGSEYERRKKKVIDNLGDVHLYLNHIEPIKEQLTREPYPLPTVKISDRVVNDISEYTLDDIILENYQSHPTIKMPLSN